MALPSYAICSGWRRGGGGGVRVVYGSSQLVLNTRIGLESQYITHRPDRSPGPRQSWAFGPDCSPSPRQSSAFGQDCGPSPCYAPAHSPVLQSGLGLCVTWCAGATGRRDRLGATKFNSRPVSITHTHTHWQPSDTSAVPPPRFPAILWRAQQVSRAPDHLTHCGAIGIRASVPLACR